MKYFKLTQEIYSRSNDWSKLNNKWKRDRYSRDFTHLLFQPNRPTKSKNWRWRMREKAKQQYSLEELVNIVPKEDRQTIFKELCYNELQPFIQKKKQERNSRRNELTRWSIRNNFPQDTTCHILQFIGF